MLKIILDLLIFISLGVIIYSLARSLPRVNDNRKDVEGMEISPVLIYLEKMDQHLKSFSEKLLRRIRIVILRFENMISERIKGFREDKNKTANFDIEIDKEEDKEEN